MARPAPPPDWGLAQLKPQVENEVQRGRHNNHGHLYDIHSHHTPEGRLRAASLGHTVHVSTSGDGRCDLVDNNPQPARCACLVLVPPSSSSLYYSTAAAAATATETVQPLFHPIQQSQVQGQLASDSSVTAVSHVLDQTPASSRQPHPTIQQRWRPIAIQETTSPSSSSLAFSSSSIFSSSDLPQRQQQNVPGTTHSASAIRILPTINVVAVMPILQQHHGFELFSSSTSLVSPSSGAAAIYDSCGSAHSGLSLQWVPRPKQASLTPGTAGIPAVPTPIVWSMQPPGQRLVLPSHHHHHQQQQQQQQQPTRIQRQASMRHFRPRHLSMAVEPSSTKENLPSQSLEKGGLTNGSPSSRRSHGGPKSPQQGSEHSASTASSPPPAFQQQQNESFPEKVHRMIHEINREQKDDIISWTPCGRAFEIHDHNTFTTDILPRYFNHQRLASFKRQLSMYGFRRAIVDSGLKGYAHERFHRDRPELCASIKRTYEIQLKPSSLRQKS